ncbi:hypothetical protein FX155_07690 [Acidaminococcus fermentans]|uniref:Uncharacterized protein n=1 Tax=Acidaminococcus fermentans TaxID=905 RepID=A0A6N7W1U3_ACIFE|nr:hypothetical protein [Acidaminococcus fermentans]MSS82473.1 hypothetical protein [Acidaminococcus fermentans]
MDKGNKVKTTDMIALQSDLMTIAAGMKRMNRLKEANHLEMRTFTGKILAADVADIRAAINGLEYSASNDCCESNCCQTCEGCQTQSCQSSTCQSCQGCQTCQSCQGWRYSQCHSINCTQCSVVQCHERHRSDTGDGG